VTKGVGSAATDEQGSASTERTGAEGRGKVRTEANAISERRRKQSGILAIRRSLLTTDYQPPSIRYSLLTTRQVTGNQPGEFGPDVKNDLIVLAE